MILEVAIATGVAAFVVSLLAYWLSLEATGVRDRAEELSCRIESLRAEMARLEDDVDMLAAEAGRFRSAPCAYTNGHPPTQP